MSSNLIRVSKNLKTMLILYIYLLLIFYFVGVFVAYTFIEMHNLSKLSNHIHPKNAIFSWYLVIYIINKTL